MSAAEGSYLIPEDVIWLAGDEEVRLYDAASGEFRTLNRTAAEIWMLITEGKTIAEITEVLTHKYAAGNARDADRLRQEAAAFMAILAEQGLLASRAPVDLEVAGD